MQIEPTEFIKAYIKEILFHLRNRVNQGKAHGDFYESGLLDKIQDEFASKGWVWRFHRDIPYLSVITDKEEGVGLPPRDVIASILLKRGFLKPNPDPEVVLWNVTENNIFCPVSMEPGAEMMLKIRDITHYEYGEGYDRRFIGYKIGNTGDVLSDRDELHRSYLGTEFYLNGTGGLVIENKATNPVVFFCTAILNYDGKPDYKIDFSFDVKAK